MFARSERNLNMGRAVTPDLRDARPRVSKTYQDNNIFGIGFKDK